MTIETLTNPVGAHKPGLALHPNTRRSAALRLPWATIMPSRWDSDGSPLLGTIVNLIENLIRFFEKVYD